VRRADNLTTLMCRVSRNPGALTSRTPQRHIGLFRGYFYMFRATMCPSSGDDKSLARPTSRFILFDGENISFDASLIIYIYIYIYIYSTNIPPIMIINRIYETQGRRVAQSVYPLPTGWMVRGPNPAGGEIFRTCPDRP
jgi:hypothetical protein